MSTKQRADVEQYIGHFRGEHEKLLGVTDQLHRKVLVVTMLDALARGRYPKSRYPKASNRDNFIGLIEEHATWPHATSVSASQLAMMIDERGGAAACGLSDELVKRLRTAQRKPWEIDGLANDPKPAELLPQFPNEREVKIVGEAKHSSLLYEHRNVLVHEYRKPGHGFEFDQRETARYYHTSEGEDRKVTVELVYPTGWFLTLIPPILDSVAAYYAASSYNPYNSYEFGSPWRKKRGTAG